MTIFVVTYGEYDEHSVLAVFSEEKLANEYVVQIAKLTGNKERNYDVEEFELDQFINSSVHTVFTCEATYIHGTKTHRERRKEWVKNDAYKTSFRVGENGIVARSIVSAEVAAAAAVFGLWKFRADALIGNHDYEVDEKILTDEGYLRPE